MKYRALQGITAPANEEATKRIQTSPSEPRKTKRYEEGDLIDYLPEISIPWLLKQGYVEEVEEHEGRRHK